MAQVFTLDFIYKHFVHSAIVSVRALGNDFSVSVQLLENGLAHIVPDGELNFRLSNASRRPAINPRPGYNELESALREAITRRLRHRNSLAVGLRS
jgi:hypothetical protein